MRLGSAENLFPFGTKRTHTDLQPVTVPKIAHQLIVLGSFTENITSGLIISIAGCETKRWKVRKSGLRGIIIKDELLLIIHYVCLAVSNKDSVVHSSL